MPHVQTQDAPRTAQAECEPRWRWVYLLVALLLMLGAVVNLAPGLLERVNQIRKDFGGLPLIVLHGLQTTADSAYASARHGVEISPEVTAALGAPLQFVPLEQLQWGDNTSDSLVFSFTVTGPQGQATAHATVRPGAEEFELISLEVATPDETILDLRKL